MDFNVAEGDKLDLADLLQGENAGNLEQYLHFSQSGDDTLLQISTQGGFSAAGANAAVVADQQILLKGVAFDSLAGAGASDHDIIAKLLHTGQSLKTDM